ncbi:MAG TPA: hypothetical protein VFW44_02630 [Bryobacteraceae bacterium]|nr:hypothetical protein [Bryobacteraceae bacterium]
MLKFNTLLKEVGIDPNDVQLVRHKDRGPTGVTPYSLMCENPGGFELYQSLQGREIFRKKLFCSFVVTPSSETLFVNLYSTGTPDRNSSPQTCPVRAKVIETGKCWVYPLSVDNRLADFSKRLVIAWGDGYRSWVQRANRQDKAVLELRRKFQEIDFPGYLQFHVRLGSLRNAYITWQTALSAQRGVYLLSFDDAQQYVGSATGQNGFWQRWQDYLATGHGGNVALRGRDAADAMVSILATARLTDTRQDILDCEYLWQEKLGTKTIRLGDE